MSKRNETSGKQNQALPVLLAILAVIAVAGIVLVLVYFNASLKRAYSFSLKQNEVIMTLDETVKLEPVYTVIDEALVSRVEKQKERARVSYKIDDDRVAVVDDNGEVRPKKLGSTSLTASWGGMKFQIPVYVIKAVDEIHFEMPEYEVQVGEKIKLSYNYIPPDFESADKIRFSVSDPEKASVDAEGMLSAIHTGDVEVTVYCAGVKDTCTVHVVCPAEEITLNATQLELMRGETFEFQALVRPEENTDNDTIHWDSTNRNVAEVSENGFVMAVGFGDADIVATYGNIQAVCRVSVSVPLDHFYLLASELSAEPGNDYYIPVYYDPAEGHTLASTWESSDPSVCSVYEKENVNEAGERSYLLCVEVEGVGVSVITGRYGNKTCSCTVSSGTSITGLKVSQDSMELEAGETGTLYGIFSPEGAGASQDVLWVSSDPSIASVTSDGVVRGVSEGECMITAVYSGLHDYCTVKVEGESETEETRNYAGRILIGDSRMVYLSKFVSLDPGDIVIAKGAQYFSWFKNTAVPALREILTVNPNYEVIINMGVNDCANNVAGWSDFFAYDYIDLIRSLQIEFPRTRFFYASVGYCDGRYDGKIEGDFVNAMADLFNRVVMQATDIGYVDMCEYLNSTGFTTLDGVHYDQATCQKIYDYFKLKVPVN